jgi:hypothetical protein
LQLQSFRNAALQALGDVAAVVPNEALPLTVPTLATLLTVGKNTLQSLTPNELGIYHTPEGELFQTGIDTFMSH